MPNMSKMLDMSQMSRDVEICRQYVQIHTNMIGYVLLSLVMWVGPRANGFSCMSCIGRTMAILIRQVDWLPFGAGFWLDFNDVARISSAKLYVET